MLIGNTYGSESPVFPEHSLTRHVATHSRIEVDGLFEQRLVERIPDEKRRYDAGALPSRHLMVSNVYR